MVFLAPKQLTGFRLRIVVTVLVLLSAWLCLPTGGPAAGARFEDIHVWENQRDIDSLILALGDNSFRVRRVAAESLDRLNEPLGRLIYDSLSDSQDARKELARKKDPRAVAPLIKALDNESILVRRAAAKTLEQIADPHASDALIRALGDTDPGVRETAVLALQAIGTSDAVDPLIETLRDEHPKMREFGRPPWEQSMTPGRSIH